MKIFPVQINVDQFSNSYFVSFSCVWAVLSWSEMKGRCYKHFLESLITWRCAEILWELLPALMCWSLLPKGDYRLLCCWALSNCGMPVGVGCEWGYLSCLFWRNTSWDLAAESRLRGLCCPFQPCHALSSPVPASSLGLQISHLCSLLALPVPGGSFYQAAMMLNSSQHGSR